MKQTFCSLILLLASFSAYAEQASILIGNGLGMEVEFDKVAFYVESINSKEYTIHVGADYIFHRGQTFSLGLGGGGTTVVHDFAAVDGFTASKDTETIPFLAISLRSQYFFVKVLYADTDFITHRVKNFTGDPNDLVFRTDTASGPEFGAFVGFKILLP